MRNTNKTRRRKEKCIIETIKKKEKSDNQTVIFNLFKSSSLINACCVMHVINPDDSLYLNENSSSSSSSPSLCAHENCTNEISSSIIANTFPNSLLIILILSVLCFFGVCFMIFGPLQRSEAHKRIENYTFGRHPIFNVDHRKQSTTTRFDESMEFSSI